MRALRVDGLTDTRELDSDGVSRWLAAQWRAPGDQRCLVIRELLPALCAQEPLAARWARVAAQNAECDHPSVFPLVDWGIWNGRLCTAHEQVSGASLATLIKVASGRKSTLSAAAAVHLACSILGALEYVADKQPGMLHLDLRPQRVHVDPKGNVFLGEFGLWTLLEPTEITRRRFDAGEVHHLAPEVVQSMAADARSDLFSLGAVLFELLSGQRPFAGATQLAAAMEISAGRRRTLREVSTAPTALCEVVERLLAHRPKDRYPSAHKALEAFVPLLELREVGMRELRALVQEAAHQPTATHPPTRIVREPGHVVRVAFDSPATPPSADGDASSARGAHRTYMMHSPSSRSAEAPPKLEADARLSSVPSPVPVTHTFEVPRALLQASSASEPALASGKESALPSGAGSSRWQTVPPPPLLSTPSPPSAIAHAFPDFANFAEPSVESASSAGRAGRRETRLRRFAGMFKAPPLDADGSDKPSTGVRPGGTASQPAYAAAEAWPSPRTGIFKASDPPAHPSDSGYRPYVPARRAEADKWREPSRTVFEAKVYAKGNTLRPGTQIPLAAFVALAAVFGASLVGLLYLALRILLH